MVPDAAVGRPRDHGGSSDRVHDPFRGQLERLLNDALFTPLEWTGALYMPPIDRPWIVRWSTVFERVGARLWPGFAGVIIVEASKELMGAIPKGAPARAVERLAEAQGGSLRRSE